MRPVLFEVGGISVYAYGFMISLGVITALILLYRESRSRGFDPEQVFEAVLYASLAGAIGARLLFVLLEWDWVVEDISRVLKFQEGGLSFYGAFALGLMVLFVWSRWRGIYFFHLTDFFAPYLALGYAFGRVGCFLNGCCYGVVSDIPWALPASMVDNLPRHPVQLYAAAGSLLIFFIIRYLQKHKLFPGFNMLSVIMLYGLMRFTVEFSREEDLMWGPLSMAQVFSMLLFLATGAILVFMAFKKGFLTGEQ